VWRRWLLPAGALGSLLDAAANRRTGELAEVERRLVELRDPRRIDDLVSATDRELHGVRQTRQPIEARALGWLQRYAGEAIEVVDAWLRRTRRMIEDAAGGTDYRQRTMHRLRQAVAAHRDGVLERLHTCQESDDQLVAAGALGAEPLLTEMFALIVEGRHFPEPNDPLTWRCPPACCAPPMCRSAAWFRSTPCPRWRR
jgi:hypothetical protein